ncbi:unnamed protein product [Diabrotica balteata]|uniref:Nuclease HARBI1 n=1 Tax=Diabrotica balteata TaxID=107213 RepID=A0A9N9T0P9_DIABA|nr:unnamed protein product [Diabrotica balteata]
MLPQLYKMANYTQCAEDTSNYYCSAQAKLIVPSTNLDTINLLKKLNIFSEQYGPQVIKWPSGEEKMKIERNFRQNNFPGVIGVIDGSHIKIDKPTNDPDSYLNRKHYYSIQQKFRQLYHVKLRAVPDIIHFIRACYVLHNMTIEDQFEYEAENIDENILPFNLDIDENHADRNGMERRNEIMNLLPV